MTFASIVTMVVIIALVWGGLVALLTLALRKERKKRSSKDNAT